jgi:hypothetical protein
MPAAFILAAWVAPSLFIRSADRAPIGWGKLGVWRMQKVCSMDSSDLSGAAVSFIQLIVVHKVGYLVFWGKSGTHERYNLTSPGKCSKHIRCGVERGTRNVP